MNEINYTVKRSNRRSVCIKISEDNTVSVCCPLNYSVAKIEKFVREKSGWIENHIAQNQKKNARLSEVLKYRTVLVGGDELRLEIGKGNYVTEEEVCVTSIRMLKKLLVDSCGRHFLDDFNGIAQATGLKYNDVKFRDYKSRWGCCDTKKNIAFNYKLLMLPVELQQYVMLHELCHTQEMNHSPKFYALLSSFMPDFRRRKSALKGFSPLTRLY